MTTPTPDPIPPREANIPTPDPWRWWVCILLLGATTLGYLDNMALNQLSVRLSNTFGMNKEQYGNLESAFRLAFAIGTLITGWLVDRGGVRWVYPVAVAGWSAVGFATGFVETYWMLFACRFLLGFFESANWPCGVRTVRQVMPVAERSMGNSLFQSGTALGAVLTPIVVKQCLKAVGPDDPDAWRVPFRIVGLIGFAWVVIWIATVPNRRLASVEEQSPAALGATSFWAIFRDRRFYILVLIVIGANTSWHTFRVWLPMFLQSKAGYSEFEMHDLMTGYYVAADLGAWGVGLATIVLARLSLTLHAARLITFAACTALVMLAVLVPFVGYGVPLTVVLILFGVGALGLFPTYFALSQDLSAAHQGKVTGTLGFLNALYLVVLYNRQGWYIDRTKSFEDVLAVAGIPALVAMIALYFFWRVPKST
jgi:ACS family hexuronate transporter-like MFS transporter